jgi:hypothetical protein|tara:strand:- start:1319 stop:1477 length:159 start_codon:yes stop_codon:yes gene_type:complete
MGTEIILITYVGQEESPYKRQAPSYSAALEMVEKLEQEYPDRKWNIETKDVS